MKVSLKLLFRALLFISSCFVQAEATNAFWQGMVANIGALISDYGLYVQRIELRKKMAQQTGGTVYLPSTEEVENKTQELFDVIKDLLKLALQEARVSNDPEAQKMLQMFKKVPLDGMAFGTIKGILDVEVLQALKQELLEGANPDAPRPPLREWVPHTEYAKELAAMKAELFEGRTTPESKRLDRLAEVLQESQKDFLDLTNLLT